MEESSLDISLNNFICFPQEKENHMGFQWYESE